jgi:release factor glutamine methyltransferase
MPTTGSALQIAKNRISSADAQLLLGHVLGLERAYLLAYPETVITPEQEARFAGLVERCAAGEPVPYLLGRWPFYDREFIVSPAVLIPRPETEVLLEEALHFVTEHPQAAAVDVGTGSGALAVTLAARCPEARVYAVDISPAALEIARQNAALNHTSVTYFEGDLLQPLLERGLKADLIMANLPYIARNVLAQLAVSRYEPRLALDGGPDGLDLVRRLLAQAPSVCKPGALVLLEIGYDQGAAVLELVYRMIPQCRADLLKDYAGLDRVVRLMLSM